MSERARKMADEARNSRKPHIPRSPISIPENSSGTVSVIHEQLKHEDLIGRREALFTGKKHTTVHWSSPRTVHKLLEGKQVWMSDLLVELRQHEEAIKRLRVSGRVLVGGLGLGIAATMLADRPGVKRVDVVEINPDVVQCVAPYLQLDKPGRAPINVITADVYKYIAGLTSWPYDAAFMDVWRGTNEGEWWESVFPLRRTIANKFGAQRVQYWAEDIMLGQVESRLQMAVPPHWYYRMTNLPMSKTEAHQFTHWVGMPVWEERYGALYPERGKQ